MPTSVRRLVLLAVLLVGAPGAAQAQRAEPQALFCREEARRRATLDTRGLAAVYCASPPVLTTPLRAAHATARPVFYGAVPVAWGAAYLRGEGDYTDAYRLTLTQGTTYGLVLGLKRAVGRPRPYVRRALSSRSRHYGPSKGEQYRAFPSGHAALSVALATSWGLSHPRWYVVGPGAVWAAGVSMSRLYLGVHYPSDVLVGMVIGAGVATAIHQLRDPLTPDGLRGGGPRPPPLGIRVRF
jgi:membrane-associated phospholipid phosphatase